MGDSMSLYVSTHSAAKKLHHRDCEVLEQARNVRTAHSWELEEYEMCRLCTDGHTVDTQPNGHYESLKQASHD